MDYGTYSDKVWVNAHSPSGSECDDTGAECAADGLTILGLNDAPIDLTPFGRVNYDRKEDEDAENCFNFKIYDGDEGYLKSQTCSKEFHVACFVSCGKLLL